MYGVLAEDRSDYEAIKILIRRLAGDEGTKIKGRGFSGGPELLRKGARELSALAGQGCQRFVIAHDADNKAAKALFDSVVDKIIKPAGHASGICVVIPVQEIEAWFLSDLKAATRVFTGWRPKPVSNPEHIPNPKEYLYRISQDCRGRPRYNHATHNPVLAKHVDTAVIQAKCPSFEPLVNLVCKGEANYVSS